MTISRISQLVKREIDTSKPALACLAERQSLRGIGPGMKHEHRYTPPSRSELKVRICQANMKILLDSVAGFF